MSVCFQASQGGTIAVFPGVPVVFLSKAVDGRPACGPRRPLVPLSASLLVLLPILRRWLPTCQRGDRQYELLLEPTQWLKATAHGLPVWV